ncbi:MAG TPA: phosphate ABC transporter substrate-binding protein PstS [Candidatus Limnocylindrales bacterium]
MAPSPPTGNVTLQGAGATFPAPVYGVWIETYSGQYPNVKINYQANGSGAGVKAITQQTVDFGASDAAMTDAEVAAVPAGQTVLHIPTVLGAVVITFNLEGVTALNLDGPTLANIYLGKIKEWNDPAIAALNSGATFPAKPILVVHRSDGSGTTNAFSAYLSAVSPEWKSQVGTGKELSWPTGVGAKGNDGVTTSVAQNPASIGYVEYQYASQAKLAMASVKNADGNLVAPTTAGVTAAADSVAADFPADSRQQPIVNAPGAESYPIVTYTFLLVYKDQKDATKGQALLSWIVWDLTQGSPIAEQLDYALLPPNVFSKAISDLHTVTSGGSPIWPAG